MNFGVTRKKSENMKKILLIAFMISLLTSCVTITNKISTLDKNIENNISNNGDNKDYLIEEYSIDRNKLNYYMEKNDNENRYSEYKDNESGLILKLIQLEHINKSRLEYNALPIELDILACRVANKMSIDSASNHYKGHWNHFGEKPYHRYAAAGGVAHVSENASSITSSNLLSGTSENTIRNMREMHDFFMSEIAPNDMHKLNIINKDHTNVGIGFAFINNEFRYYEEYIDDYLTIFKDKIRYEKFEDINIKFKSDYENLIPYVVLVYYEEPLKKMTAEEINRKSSYPDYTNTVVIEKWPWDLEEPDNEGYTNLHLNFKKAGTYYVHIYLSERTEPIKNSANTEGKIQASGIVLFVD